MRHYVLYPEAVRTAPELMREQVFDYCRKAGFDPYEVHTIRLIPETRSVTFEIYITNAKGEKQVNPNNHEEAWLEEITRPMTAKPPFVDLCKMEEILG